jgi:hypothetical protein
MAGFTQIKYTLISELLSYNIKNATENNLPAIPFGGSLRLSKY